MDLNAKKTSSFIKAIKLSKSNQIRVTYSQRKLAMTGILTQVLSCWDELKNASPHENADPSFLPIELSRLTDVMYVLYMITIIVTYFILHRKWRPTQEDNI